MAQMFFADPDYGAPFAYKASQILFYDVKLFRCITHYFLYKNSILWYQKLKFDFFMSQIQLEFVISENCIWGIANSQVFCNISK